MPLETGILKAKDIQGDLFSLCSGKSEKEEWMRRK